MSEYIYATDDHGNQWIKWEEIVRCKDCEFFNDFHGLCHRPVLVIDGTTNARWVDGTDETEPICATAAKPDGFCAWGVRKVVTE